MVKELISLGANVQSAMKVYTHNYHLSIINNLVFHQQCAWLIEIQCSSCTWKQKMRRKKNCAQWYACCSCNWRICKMEKKTENIPWCCSLFYIKLNGASHSKRNAFKRSIKRKIKCTKYARKSSFSTNIHFN